MEFRLLQSFLILSEELNFGRAAARLHIAQPPLTKQIHQLEKELGTELFHRHSRGVRLTPAGEALVPEATRLFADLDTAVHRVRHADTTGAGRLVIGFTGATGMGLVPGLLRKIERSCPDVNFNIVRYASSALVADAVSSGQIDLGHVILPLEHRDLETVHVAKHRSVLAVPVAHPLGQRKSLRPEDLCHEDFIAPPKYGGSALRALLHELSAAGDFSPRIVKEAPDSYTCLMLVAAGVGVTLSMTSVDVLSSAIRYVPFAEGTLTGFDSAIAWRSAESSALISGAVESISPTNLANDRPPRE